MQLHHYLKILIPPLLLLLLLIYGEKVPEYFGSSSDPVTFGVNTATILGGFVAVETLILIWIQLIVQNKQSRLERTYQFSEKLQDAEFLEHLSIALIYFKDDDTTEDEKWDGYINNFLPETAVHVYITLAFFEDMSMLYNENNISRNLIKRLLRTMIIQYYKNSKWFRDRMKEQQGKSMYKEWDKLYKALTAPWWNFLARI